MKKFLFCFNCFTKNDNLYSTEIINTSQNEINDDSLNSNKKTSFKNPFLNQSSTSTKYYNNPSPRFIDNGIFVNENEHISQKLSFKENYKKINSLISFANYPLQIVNVDKNDKNKIMGPKILCVGELFFDKQIIITMNGIIDGLRQKNDGQCFFGVKKINDYNGIPYCDFIINYELSGEKEKKDENSTGRIFNIFYQKRTKEFYLHLIHDSIIYYEINNFVYFDDEKVYYLIIGNIFVTIITRTIDNKKGIDVEIENDLGNNDFYSFVQDETPISIGRTNCKIIIPKESVSKNHSEINYSNECQKFYFRDLGSTNGSILLIKEDDYLLLQGEMNFRFENIPFKIMNLP
jgi:hypothetical protein